MKKAIILLLLTTMVSGLNSSTFYLGINKKNNKSYVVDTNKVWNPSTSTFTEWLNDGAGYNFSLYLPAITTQEEDFNQSQTYDQNQYQFEQKRVYEEALDIYKNVDEPIMHTKIENKSIDRVVNVESSSWVDDGSSYDCTDWIGNGGSIVIGEVVIENRTCKQNQNKNNIYKTSGNQIDEKNFSRVFDLDETRGLSRYFSLFAY